MLRTPIVLLAVALAAPAAVAGWSSHGGFEPDYEPDVTDMLMWAEPTKTGKQVYFNAWLSVEGSSVNPNVGATESRITYTGFQQPVAFLGVWRDCNGDSYIGMAESAATEYRSELLLDTSSCLPGSVHHHDGWVFEFIWIGSEDNTPDPAAQPFIINDTQSRVWGDYGLAGADLTGAGGCYINPATGQLSSTGGALAFVDCDTGRAIATTVNEVDRDGFCVNDSAPCTTPLNLGLAFEDENDPACSSSPLNVQLDTFNDDPSCPDNDPETLGNSHQGDRAFTVADCDASDEVGTGVESPTSGEEITVFVPGVGTPVVHSADGSWYEAVNHTWAGTYYECEAAADDSAPFLDPEAEVTTDTSAKREPDWQLQFTGYELSAVGFSFLRWNFTEDGSADTNPYVNATDEAIGASPHMGGLGYPTNVAAYNFVPSWYSGVSSTNPGAIPIRSDGTSVSGAPPVYYTFYASVGAATLAWGGLTPGGQGTYAVEWCGTNTSDVVLGVDCDKSHWWQEKYGASAMETEYYTDRAIGVVPGHIYQLRDIDCYDGSVASGIAPGVGLGLTLLDETEGPCA